MKNKIWYIILFLLLIILGVIVYVEINSSDNLGVLYIKGQDVTVTFEDSVIEDDNLITYDNIIVEDDLEFVSDDVDINNDLEDYDGGQVLDTYFEEDVVSYFETMEEEVSESSTFKEKFKEYFVTVVDFIFYNEEIKGYTFDELSSNAKVRIVSVALRIDAKIEEYVPNYKETISSTSSDIYNSVKEELVILYMNISTDICKDNVNDCDNVKEILSDIKSVCKIGWEFVKGIVSGGTSKLKDWYEIYSGK